MVVMFRGTSESKNYAPQVLALYAGINAVKYNRKTLVLQFMTPFPVETILNGKKRHEMELLSEDYEFRDTGIDSLFRKIETQRIEKEQFDTSCTPMVTSENLLDVAEVSRKPDFEDEVCRRGEEIGMLISFAKEVYEDIFILANGKREDMCQVLNPFCDISLICVPQGNQEEILEPGENTLLIVTNFDRRSSYDVNKMKKIYDVKRISLFPYNPNFKDAYNTDNVIQFVLKNSKVEAQDANYELMSMVYDVEKKILNNDFPEDEEMNFPRLRRRVVEENTATRDVLNRSNVRYTKGYGGLTGRKPSNGYEVSYSGFNDDVPEKKRMKNAEPFAAQHQSQAVPTNAQGMDQGVVLQKGAVPERKLKKRRVVPDQTPMSSEQMMQNPLPPQQQMADGQGFGMDYPGQKQKKKRPVDGAPNQKVKKHASKRMSLPDSDEGEWIDRSIESLEEQGIQFFPMSDDGIVDLDDMGGNEPGLSHGNLEIDENERMENLDRLNFRNMDFTSERRKSKPHKSQSAHKKVRIRREVVE